MARCMAWHGRGAWHGASHGAAHGALHGASRRGRHLVKEDLEPPRARGARLPMRRRAGGHAARLARYDLAVHRERDHIRPQLGEEGAAAQREQCAEASMAEALLVAHTPHAPPALARLAAAAAAIAAAIAAAAAAKGEVGRA